MRERRIAFGIFLLHVIRLALCQVNMSETTSTISLSNVTSSSTAESFMSTNSMQTPDVNSTQDFNSTFSRGLPNTEYVTTLKANDMTSSTIAATQTSILSTAMSVESRESLSSGEIVVTTQTSTTLMTKSSTSALPIKTESVKPTQSSSSEEISVITPLYTVLMTKSSTRDIVASTDVMTSEKSMMTSHEMMKHSTIKRVTLPSAGSHTTMKATDNVTIQHPNANAIIIVSIVAVVFFVAVITIALICVCRRRNKKNKHRTLMVSNQPPTVHASHRKLDFENLNDASSPGEFLLDKTIIDLESPNTDDHALQALAMLDHATEEFGSKEIITFKTNSQEQLSERNGDVPNKSEHASDSEEENSEPDEKEKSDDKENKEGSDTKAGDSVLNKEYTNEEKVEKELATGTETKPNDSAPTRIESNSEPKGMEISGKEESENKPITGSETKTEDFTPVSEL